MVDPQVNPSRFGAVPTVVPASILDALRNEAELLREEGVFGGGSLRLFRLGERHLVQETSDREEILLRGYGTREEAEAFLARRLEDYERQWDG